METTMAITDSAQVLESAFFSNQEREMAAASSRYWRLFYRHAFRYLRNVADAEDAVQDALLSACKNIGQFREEAKMSTWLTAIVINSARMQLRQRPRQMHVSLDEHAEPENYALSELLPDHRPNPAEQCLRSDFEENVLQLTRRLSPTLRTAFRLRDVEGLTIREMVKLLGVPAGTVKTRIGRARAKMRSLISKGVGKQVVIDIGLKPPRRK